MFDYQKAAVACAVAYEDPNQSYDELMRLGLVKSTVVDAGPDVALWLEFPEFDVLAIRGSEFTWSDWSSNLFACRVPSDYGKLHAGFFTGWANLHARVCKNLNGRDPKRRLYVTGHSRGGAIALIAALQIADHGHPAVGVVTFGSPKVGNGRRIRRALVERSITHTRVVNSGDPVPGVPWFFSYGHDCPATTLGRRAFRADHSMREYWARICRADLLFRAVV